MYTMQATEQLENPVFGVTSFGALSRHTPKTSTPKELSNASKTPGMRRFGYQQMRNLPFRNMKFSNVSFWLCVVLVTNKYAISMFEMLFT